MWGAYSSWIFRNRPFFQFGLSPVKLMYGCGKISLGFCSIFWTCEHHIRKIEVLQRLHGTTSYVFFRACTFRDILHLWTLSSAFKNSVWCVGALTDNRKKVGKKLQLGYTTGVAQLQSVFFKIRAENWIECLQRFNPCFTTSSQRYNLFFVFFLGATSEAIIYWRADKHLTPKHK